MGKHLQGLFLWAYLVIISAHGMEFADGKQALYIYACNLLPKRKQTITGSETCEDTAGPCNQSAS